MSSGVSQATCTSDHLAMNSGFLFTPSGFDNLLEQLTELFKILNIGLKLYYSQKIQIRTSQKKRPMEGVLRGPRYRAFMSPGIWMHIDLYLPTRKLHFTEPVLLRFYYEAMIG